jgi:hypothetical protein
MGRFSTLEPADLIAPSIPQEAMRPHPTTNQIDFAWYLLLDRRPRTKKEAIENLSPLGWRNAVGILNFLVKYGFADATGGDIFRVQKDAPAPSTIAQLLKGDLTYGRTAPRHSRRPSRVTDSKNPQTHQSRIEEQWTPQPTPPDLPARSNL